MTQHTFILTDSKLIESLQLISQLHQCSVEQVILNALDDYIDKTQRSIDFITSVMGKDAT